MSGSSAAESLQLPDKTYNIYTLEQKTNILLDVFNQQNVYGVAEQHGVSPQIVLCWMEEPWAEELKQRFLSILTNRFDTGTSILLDRVVNEIDERLTNGDEKVYCVTNQGDYQLVTAKQKVSAKDLAFIAGILYDKRALSRGQPTTITQVDKLEQMAQMLRDAQGVTIDHCDNSHSHDNQTG